MDVISIKEFAQNRGVTYEAVRKQVAKYEEELRDHIVKRGRVQYLDEYAQKLAEIDSFIRIEQAQEQKTALQNEYETVISAQFCLRLFSIPAAYAKRE